MLAFYILWEDFFRKDKKCITLKPFLCNLSMNHYQYIKSWKLPFLFNFKYKPLSIDIKKADEKLCVSQTILLPLHSCEYYQISIKIDKKNKW